MTIILFLVDTSVSMNQKTYMGTNFLDVAKGAVETFLKLRVKDPSSRGQDRYMLLTLEEPPKNIKVGWREGQTVFQEQLKQLKAYGLTSLGSGLGEALRFLNLNRLASGIDNYGMGRFPYFLEQAVIVCITDGSSLTSLHGVDREIHVPRPSSLGNELTDEPFRWDQRIFSLVLRFPGHNPPPYQLGPISADSSPVDAMCVATGGRSYTLTSHRMLYPCIESIVSKIQTGPVLCLEKYGPDPVLVVQEDLNTNATVENGFVRNNIRKDTNGNATKTEAIWHKTLSVMYVKIMHGRPFNGHWPIPEAFWPDPISSALPSRTAHPIIKFRCEPLEPLVFQEFPFDKYELEPSPLTQFILERKQPNICWQVFLPGSARHEGLGHPFGYLKASTTLSCVNMFIMPYNYPVLLPLLEELRNGAELRTKPSTSWRSRFDKYLKTVPPYYCGPLRKALMRLNLGSVMPGADSDQPYSYSVLSYTTKIKHTAQEELNRLCETVKQQLMNNNIVNPLDDWLTVKARNPISLTAHSQLKSLLRGSSGETTKTLEAELQKNDFREFRVYAPATNTETLRQPSCMFRNAYDIPRSQLLSRLVKMRLNLTQELSNSNIPVLEGGMPGTKLGLHKAEDLHNLPISQMGNYQDYLNQMPAPLREVEAAPVRVHAFGNPFKIDKRNMFVDEADIENLLATSTGSKSGKKPTGSDQSDPKVKRSNLPPKRKPGPLSKDFKDQYRIRRKRRRLDSAREDDEISIISDTSSMFSDTESIASDIQSDTESIVENHQDEGHLVIDDSLEEASPSSSISPVRVETANVPQPRLSTVELVSRKKLMKSLVRRPGRGSKVGKVIQETKNNLVSNEDRTCLLQLAVQESRRFKKGLEYSNALRSVADCEHSSDLPKT